MMLRTKIPAPSSTLGFKQKLWGYEVDDGLEELD